MLCVKHNTCEPLWDVGPKLNCNPVPRTLAMLGTPVLLNCPTRELCIPAGDWLEEKPVEKGCGVPAILIIIINN